MHNAISNCIHKRSNPSDAEFARNVQQFTPLIEELARKLMHIADINRQVHGKIYNRLIEAELKQEGAAAGGAAAGGAAAGGAAAGGAAAAATVKKET